MPAAERWAEVEEGVANRTSGLPIGLGMRDYVVRALRWK
jgi:hypothetical protein